MKDKINSIGFCPNCGRTLQKYGDSKTLCFRVGSGTMFINANYEYCPYCGLDENIIENFYKALEESANKVITIMRKGDKNG